MKKLFNLVLLVICTFCIVSSVKAIDFYSINMTTGIENCIQPDEDPDYGGRYSNAYGTSAFSYCRLLTEDYNPLFCLNIGKEFYGGVPYELTKTITGNGLACGVLDAYEAGKLSIPSSQPEDTTYFFNETINKLTQYDIQKIIWDRTGNDSTCVNTTTSGEKGTLVVPKSIKVTKSNADDNYYTATINLSFSNLTDSAYEIYDVSSTLRNSSTQIKITGSDGKNKCVSTISGSKCSTGLTQLTIQIPSTIIPKDSSGNVVGQDAYELVFRANYSQKTVTLTPIIMSYDCSLNECKNSGGRYQTLGKIGIRRAANTNSFGLEQRTTIVYEPWGRVTLYKVDGDTNEVLKGAKFKILDKNGNPAKDIDGNAFGTLETDDKGRIIFNKLPYGDYTLVEVEAPEGYEISNPETKITVNRNTIVKKVYNNSPEIVISKKDITNENELEGALISIVQIKDGKEIPVIDFTSGKEEYKFNIGIGKYKLKEVSVPDGYEPLNVEFEFEVLEGGKIKLIGDKDKHISSKENKITLYNDPIQTIISKQDIVSEKEIEGAHIVITDESGNIVDEFDSTKEDHKFILSPGKYKLTETVSPDGYEKLETSFDFEVLDNKDINLLGIGSDYIKSDKNKIILYNRLVEVDVPDTGRNGNLFLVIGFILLTAGLSTILVPFARSKKLNNSQ